MAAPALALPGVAAHAMPRATPWWQHALLEAAVAVPEAAGGVLLRYQLARAAALPTAAERLARYRMLRERFSRADARHAAMLNVALAGLRVERPLARGPALSWVEGPNLGTAGVLLYVPGGSFVVPRSPHFTAMIARIARAAGAKAAIVDYRLAPEHPGPAAVEDVEAAFLRLTAQGHPAEAIVMVAESAGGAIALAAAQRLVARGQQPGGLALLSPWVDTDPRRTDIHPVARQCAVLWHGGGDGRDPLRNPLYGAMQGLPPIAIHANSRDPMFADAESLARRAAATGVAVELRWWPGRMHVLERYDDADARRSVAEIAGFVERCCPRRLSA